MQIYNNLISPINQAMRHLKKLDSYMIKDIIMFKMASHRVKIIIVPIETKIAINQGQSLLLKSSNKEVDTITKLGMRHGHGKFYYQDGGMYDGNWSNNKMDGFGSLYYQSGELAYQGMWR